MKWREPFQLRSSDPFQMRCNDPFQMRCTFTPPTGAKRNCTSIAGADGVLELLILRRSGCMDAQSIDKHLPQNTHSHRTTCSLRVFPSSCCSSFSSCSLIVSILRDSISLDSKAARDWKLSHSQDFGNGFVLSSPPCSRQYGPGQ
eukprot:1145456-Pelagomonas_calceolata.AAC.2